jgi:hypothetical protein
MYVALSLEVVLSEYVQIYKFRSAPQGSPRRDFQTYIQDEDTATIATSSPE